jgi:hypothetical protein
MKRLFTALALLVASSVMASQARMDVSGHKDGINLAPGSKSAGCAVSNPGWVKNEAQKKMSIYFASPRLKDEWKQVEYSFTPDKDGKLNLTIRGQWHNAKKGVKPYYVYYKNVEIVTGSTLQNGDFSKKDQDGFPTSWRFNKKNPEKPVVSEADGATMVKMQFSNGMTQSIAVKAGQEVKIRATIKSAMP